jgi:hypothetical protein
MEIITYQMQRSIGCVRDSIASASGRDITKRARAG